jgi:hypothetical protein
MSLKEETTEVKDEPKIKEEIKEETEVKDEPKKEDITTDKTSKKDDKYKILKKITKRN